MNKSVKRLSRIEAEDLVVGALILGCGGGGDPQVARGIIDLLFSQEKELYLLDPDDLDENARIAILGYVGGGVDPEEVAANKDTPKIWETPIIQAAEELASHLGIEFDAYLCSEIGAGNIMANVLVAAMEGKPIIDGDAIGNRAKPEMSISLTTLVDLPITPLAATTHYGDVIVVNNTSDPFRAERLCRYLARASSGRLAVARCPSKGSEIKKAIQSHSISLAIELGKIIREEEHTVDKMIEVMGGKRLFEGTVEKFTRENKGGFVWGDIYLRGRGKYKGTKYHIWYKNENLIAWKDDALDITCPELIMIVDADNGKGMYNWGDQFQPGKEVVVIGMSAPEMWKTAKGLDIFGPEHFGFDFAYKSCDAS